MSHNHNCPCTEACPLQRAIKMIGGKWKLARVEYEATDKTKELSPILLQLAQWASKS